MTQAVRYHDLMETDAKFAGMRAIAMQNGKITDVDPQSLSNYESAQFVWLHIEGVNPDGQLDLPAFVPNLAANALLASETRPRCDTMLNGALINLRGTGVRVTTDSDQLVSIRVWVEANRVTSVTRNPLAALELVEAAMPSGRISDGGDFVAALAQAISNELDPQVAELGDSLDGCESEIEHANIYSLRRRITQLRSHAIGLRRFVAPDRDALQTMARLDFEWISDDDRLHLRDAADRFARMAEELEAVRERAALLHEQLTDLRAELVDSRSLAIAVVAFIFLPLTFITGLLGMNVEGIPFATSDWAFWGVVAFCVFIGLVVLGWFALRQWLDE